MPKRVLRALKHLFGFGEDSVKNRHPTKEKEPE